MKNLLILLCLFSLICNISFASSIAEELTKLNNLFKEGAITKEEFSKAKSILLKTEDITETVEKKKKPLTEKKNKKIEDQKVLETISMKCKYFSYQIDREKDYATVYKKQAGYWEMYAERSKIDEKTILPETAFRSEKSIEILKGGYRLETYVKHAELTNGICKQCKIILDFKKLRKKGKGNWKGKPYNLNEKCKLIES